jgi:hypothetical protein
MRDQRTAVDNAIYSALVRYTALGRAIWETTDHPRYNDYVIYDSMGGKRSEATRKSGIMIYEPN